MLNSLRLCIVFIFFVVGVLSSVLDLHKDLPLKSALAKGVDKLLALPLDPIFDWMNGLGVCGVALLICGGAAGGDIVLGTFSVLIGSLTSVVLLISAKSCLALFMDSFVGLFNLLPFAELNPMVMLFLEFSFPSLSCSFFSITSSALITLPKRVL